MIVAKTPLRISFFGGGSDLPGFYEAGLQGACLSATIDKHIYQAINIPQYDTFKIVYSVIEQVSRVEDIKHDIVRETLKHFHITERFELSTFADIPVSGTGMGSSSSFAVGLVNACSYLYNKKITTHELAEMASMIEMVKCKQPIGKQDQYAAAYGGFNLFRFASKTGHVTTIPVGIGNHTIERLRSRLMLFYTGVKRDAKTVLENVSYIDAQQTAQKLANQAEMGYMCLLSDHLDAFGHLLDDAWILKKQLNSAVTTNSIDEAYALAKQRGALGGKILGAGGGGYLLVFAPPGAQHDIERTLTQECGYVRHHFNFTNEGSKVVYG